MVSTWIRFSILGAIKLVSIVGFKHQVTWVGRKPDLPWSKVKLVVLLNHTSLFEPLYAAHMPWSFLWRVAKTGIFPGADITLDQPIAGFLLKMLAKDVVTITRKRDASWDLFLQKIESESIVLMAPEGRMKRGDGLDKHGKPMTVRGGIADVLQRISEGEMLIGYSGGLHHIAPPGRRVPRFCKPMSLALEQLDIGEYLTSLEVTEDRELKSKIMADLQARRDRHVPAAPS